MRRSRLDLYVDIICALAQRPLTLDEVAFHCGMSCTALQQRIVFLIEHDIITFEVSDDNRTFYRLTPRGMSIFKTFSIAKHLEKLQGTPQMQETLGILSELDQQNVNNVWRNQNR